MSSCERTKTANGYSSLHPQFNLYESDGRGRDYYITYNNGGFWKDNLFKIQYTPNYTRKYKPRFFSLTHPTPPFTYYSDGTGRDGYVLFDHGLKKVFNPANKFVFDKELREPYREGRGISYKEMSKGEILRNRQLYKTQTEVTSRLYHPIKNKNLPYLINDEVYKDPLIKFYAKTGCNFYINPRGKFALASPKCEDKRQNLFRKGKKKIRIKLNDI